MSVPVLAVMTMTVWEGLESGWAVLSVIWWPSVSGSVSGVVIRAVAPDAGVGVMVIWSVLCATLMW